MAEREVELEGGIKGRGDAGGVGMPEAAEGEETGNGGLEKGAEEEEAGNTGASGGGTRGRELRQFPESPGRQREQGVPPLPQEHLRHFEVPLQRQQRVETEAKRVETEAERVEIEAERVETETEWGTNLAVLLLVPEDAPSEIEPPAEAEAPAGENVDIPEPAHGLPRGPCTRS